MRKEIAIIQADLRPNIFGNLIVWVRVKCVYEHPGDLSLSPEFYVWRKAKKNEKYNIKLEII